MFREYSLDSRHTMEKSKNFELIFLIAVWSICSGFNESADQLADNVATINDSQILREVSGDNTNTSFSPDVKKGSEFGNISEITDSISRSFETPVIQTATFVGQPDIRVVNRVLPEPPLNNGTHLGLQWSAVVVINGSMSNETIHGIDWIKIETGSAHSVTEAPLQTAQLLCKDCLPKLKVGSDLYLGVAEWNDRICGLSVCNGSLSKSHCESGDCDKCHCDPECTHYGDCCPDLFLTRDPQTPAAELSCFSPQFIKSTVISSKSYKMASGCVDVTDKFDTEACLNPDPMLLEDNRPVYSQLTQLHYRNLHCARCNGVANVVSWDAKPFCQNYVDFSTVRSQEELLQKLRVEKHCAIHYIPPVASSLRECFIRGDIVRTCNVTGTWLPDEFQSEIERACGLYSQPITLNGTNYNNVFCAKCNGEQLWASRDCSFPIHKPPVVPFSMLLNVRSAANKDVLLMEEVTCAGNQVYDPNVDACRPFWCPRGSFPENHQCTRLFKSATGLGYVVHFTLIPKDTGFIVVDDGYRIVYKTVDFITKSLSILNPELTIFNFNITYVSHNGTEFADVYSLDVQAAIIIGMGVPVLEAERSMADLLIKPVWLYDSLSSELVYFDITWLPDISSDRLKGSGYAENIVGSRPYEVLSWRTYHINGMTEIKEIPAVFFNDTSAYIHVSGLLMCKIIELNTTEFFVNDSRTITVKHTGKILKEGEFLWNGDKVQICTNFTGHKVTSETSGSREFDQTEVILTLVCTSLSLCGLAITLIIYLILPSLRTLPARNNIFLFSNLFLAQLLFLTGSPSKVSQPVCRTMGIIIHYFWMSTFCWKVICGYHMYKLFVNPLKALRYSRSLLRYILFAQLTPCVIIGLVLGVNLALSERKRYGYAERPNLCFLSGTLDVALGFVTPVCLAVLFNVFFFTRVVYVLRSRPKLQRHTSQSDVKESVLYFKMSLILGFTWVLGFLALIVNDKGVWYVFTVVNASVGVFVFLGFGLKNLSLTSLIPGFGNKNELTNNSSKTYETGDGNSKSNFNGKYSPEHLFSDSVCSTPEKLNGKA